VWEKVDKSVKNDNFHVIHPRDLYTTREEINGFPDVLTFLIIEGKPITISVKDLAMSGCGLFLLLHGTEDIGMCLNKCFGAEIAIGFGRRSPGECPCGVEGEDVLVGDVVEQTPFFKELTDDRETVFPFRILEGANQETEEITIVNSITDGNSFMTYFGGPEGLLRLGLVLVLVFILALILWQEEDHALNSGRGVSMGLGIMIGKGGDGEAPINLNGLKITGKELYKEAERRSLDDTDGFFLLILSSTDLQLEFLETQTELVIFFLILRNAVLPVTERLLIDGDALL
jgi:hypothetical protein